jgi:16S rRNA (guanine966-N2)-methyltransferase
MRISGGKARGIPLRVNKKSGVRPAIETSRERVFSSISQKVENAQVLDLFAGSGAYGLEALSRGATHATLVEKNRLVVSDLYTNLTAVQKSAQLSIDSGRVTKRDVLDFLQEKPTSPYDLIFIDPPYAELEKLCPKIFSLLASNQYLGEGGIAVLECAGDFSFEPNGWVLQRTIGKEKKGSPVHRVFETLA